MLHTKKNLQNTVQENEWGIAFACVSKDWRWEQWLSNMINKKNILGYISPICPEAPHGRLFTKFCIAVEVVDVITRDKFFSDRLRDVDSVGGQIYRVPVGWANGS